jgi:hypothetical protein
VAYHIFPGRSIFVAMEVRGMVYGPVGEPPASVVVLDAIAVVADPHTNSNLSCRMVWKSLI